jgi:pimeloyl-ACP methyl ester carboxylesterase
MHLLQHTSLVEDYAQSGMLSPDAFARITTPTMLIYGEKSHFLPTFEFLKEALPSCRPVLLPDAEHFGPLERPESLARHIGTFLIEEQPPIFSNGLYVSNGDEAVDRR